MTVKRALAVAIRQISLGFAISSLIVGPVMAAPQGGVVASGTAHITVDGNNTNINQTSGQATIT